MPLPIAIAGALSWGARVAAGLAISYACEKVVEKATNDNPVKYACYLVPTGGAVRAGAGVISKGARLSRILVKRPSYLRPFLKNVGGKVVQSVLRLPSKAMGAITGIVGGLTRLVLKNPLVQFGIAAGILGAIIGTTNFVVNFNINQTDDELIKKIEEQIKNFYGLFGGAVGSATGYLMCGALPGTLMFAFNPAVAKIAMDELEEEAKQEIYGQVANISRLTLQTLINSELTRQFMNARRYLKRNPEHPIAVAIKKVMDKYGGKGTFEKWGNANQPSFTISENIIKKQIDTSVKDPDWKKFTEEFLENFTEACIESGFIVANTIDSQIAANVLAQRNIIGQPVEVSIELNPSLPAARSNRKK